MPVSAIVLSQDAH